MARHRSAEPVPEVVDLPDRLADCVIEDWVTADDDRPPDHWPTTTNGRPTAEFPGALAFHLERTAQRRWNAARRAWADNGLDARTFPTGRPRWRTDPTTNPPPRAAD